MSVERTLRDMTDAEIDTHAAMHEAARHMRMRPLWEGTGLAAAGVSFAVVMFGNTHMPGLTLAGGLAIAVILLSLGVFRLLANVGPNRFESMLQSRASMRLNRPQVEEFRFRVHRAWDVDSVDEDSDAFLLDAGDNCWIYTNGYVSQTDAGAPERPTIPSVWRVTRWSNGGPVEVNTEPPAITVRELDQHLEQLPKVIVEADWTFVLLSFDELPSEWQASVRAIGSS